MSDDRSSRAHPLAAWRMPLLTVVGMSLAVGSVALVESVFAPPTAGSLVLVAVLAMTLSRSRLLSTWRGRLEAVVLLPLLGVATFGVGELLRFVPVAGAALFVVAMFLGIWLRRFGSTGTRIGSLIALPFLTLLIVPGGGASMPLWTAALLGVVALVVVVLVRVVAEVTRMLPRATSTIQTTTRPSRLRPIASTRMALQLALALVAAFVVGALLFPEHVTWVVLTAYLVNSGNRGRADVLTKSGLRILGAVAGTLVASTGLSALVRADVSLRGPLLAVILLALIAVGLWLRQVTYAAWALVMTLVITLLQGAMLPATAAPIGGVLWERVLAIVVGAMLGLASAWFLLPVRSEPVVRLRISEALVAIGDFLAEPTPITDAVVEGRLDRLEEIAAPWRALDRATWWRTGARRPAEWMRLVEQSAALARRHPRADSSVRKALGAARSAAREPDGLGPALVELRNELLRQGRMGA